MKKSQVFISCGQANKREREFGDLLVKYFKSKGFDAYFADHVHSSTPLLQSILNSLRESDYFVAWNPSRKDTGKIGSLFVQQEIAIASAFQLPSIYLYDSGVEKTAGMSGALHLNGIEINKPTDLASELDMLTGSWDNMSKNQFFLEFGNPSIGLLNLNGYKTNWWHISTKNGSSYKQSSNTMAYVQKIKNATSSTSIATKYQCELIWAGTGIHSLVLRSNTTRDFDAIYTVQGSRLWNFQTLQTSTIYAYPQLSDGVYEIIYSVMSDNFPSAKLKVLVKLENDNVQLLNQKQL
jgi:hypothetical protein